MPTANTNTAIRRIEAGSIITFNDGTTTWTLVGLRPGTLKWKRGGYTPIEYRDRDTLQTPLQGMQNACELELDVRYSGAVNANDLYTALKTAGSSGLVKTFSVVIKIPTYAGATAGEQLTFATCYLDGIGALAIESGVDGDTLKVKLKDNEIEPSGTTY